MKNLFITLVLLACEICFGQSLGDVVSGDDKKTEPSKVATASTQKSKGNPQNNFDAIFLKASQGDASAQFALGSIYLAGTPDVQANPELALEWIEKSAKQGNIPAMNTLGAIYGQGKFVKRDFTKAVYWRELAAEKGSATDKFALANAYLFGYMLPADNAKAGYWFTKSAEGGHICAIEKMISVSKARGDKSQERHWKTQLSYAQIKEAEKGNVNLMFEVYKKYIGGKGGLFRSIPKAIYWLRRAAEGGHIQAINTLALFYINGKYVGKDFQKGISMLELLGKVDANYAERIAILYATTPEHKDMQKAMQWLDKSASMMDNMNKIHLVWRLWSGIVFPKDTAKALSYCDEILAKEKSESVRKITEKIRTQIQSGAEAPKNFGELYK